MTTENQQPDPDLDAIAREYVGRYCDPLSERDADAMIAAFLEAHDAIANLTTTPAETSGATLDDIDEAARQCVRETLEHEEAAWTPCSKIIRELVTKRELNAARLAGGSEAGK